ncbi:zinc ribbon domain-containing protein [Halobacillus karajensis]|uniref:Membrane protein n=1 Tax=Halobacillus karajensis TaxID=195088 RepID=A0A024PA29_9BACI|nr:zinc ribbon domain-containing protein [Halobacillus karajensis]CDQ20085.1 putative membrane protein [Halobacillus karajensis]CDQ25252.1 putative membrane protein [Halobacillus karajensis]CDQ28387.1 putative membrane protein [Halobacillus karajensis]
MIKCPHCNHELNDGARFCSQCGKNLERASESNIKARRSWLPIITPVILLVVMGVALYFVYDYQKNINHEVAAMKKEAEEVALKGEYREAEKLLVGAINHRPEVEALQNELNHVQEALSWENELEAVGQLIENGSLEEANKELSAIQEALRKENSRLLVTLVPKMNELDSKLTLKEVNQELSKITDVDELAAKLDTLSNLNLEEASKVREKIYEKIINQSTKKAEAAAGEKRYTEAIATIDQGLQYVSNDKKLIQMKERIQQEKEAFEQAEQQRLESAMQQAAKDELRNETQALEVVDLSITKDEFGDYKVSGELKSVATQIISKVTVKYDILNKDGKAVRSEAVKVFPNYLNPKDLGNFEKMHYELEEGEYSVEISEMEWLVE